MKQVQRDPYHTHPTGRQCSICDIRDLRVPESWTHADHHTVECGFRIERGSYYIGPCRLFAGHQGRHDPHTREERREITARIRLAFLNGWNALRRSR